MKTWLTDSKLAPNFGKSFCYGHSCAEQAQALFGMSEIKERIHGMRNYLDAIYDEGLNTWQKRLAVRRRQEN